MGPVTEASKTYFVNTNANHTLGKKAKACLEETTNEIAAMFKVKPQDGKDQRSS